MAIAANTISPHDLFGTLGVFSILCFRDLYFLKALCMAIAANTTSDQLFFCVFWTLYLQKENIVCKHISLSANNSFEVRTCLAKNTYFFARTVFSESSLNDDCCKHQISPFSLWCFFDNLISKRKSMYFPKYSF